MPISESDLHAYADAALEGVALAEAEAHLAAHPDDAERVRVWREMNAALRQAYDPVLEEPVPARLMSRKAGRSTRLAIAAGLVAVGFAVGWITRNAFVAPPTVAVAAGGSLAHQAALAHAVYSPEVRHPVEVWAQQESHLVAWLSKRLGTTLKCPTLTSVGYDLVGGRLLPGSSGPVAQFMFQDARGTRLTLYVTAQRDNFEPTAFRFSQEDKVAVFYWIDGKYGYALSGEIARPELLRVANLVYRQINPE